MSALDDILAFDVPHDPTEREALCASPVACAVADAWAAMTRTQRGLVRIPQGLGLVALADNLDALELATRESPLRKVRP